jgi:hypothetical protein
MNAGVRPPGAGLNSTNRSGRVPAPQWHPLSPEPLHQLSLYRAVPGGQDLIEAALIWRPGADDLGWLDELTY